MRRYEIVFQLFLKQIQLIHIFRGNDACISLFSHFLSLVYLFFKKFDFEIFYSFSFFFSIRNEKNKQIWSIRGLLNRFSDNSM